MLKKIRVKFERSKAFKRFRRSKVAIFGSAIVIAFLAMGIFAPIIAPRRPESLTPGASFRSPSTDFFFGTDNIGRDIFSWFVWGSRTSLVVGAGAVFIELLIGVPLGMLAGYYGKWIDQILMRITDIMLCLPGTIILIVASSMFETRSVFLLMVIMGALGWPMLARITRAQFLSLKELSYVEEARAIGVSDIRIIIRHIFPSTIPSIVVLATLDLPWYIVNEATLTFLGLGDPTAVSWGLMVSLGKTYLRRAPWVSTFPGLAIFLATLGFNLFGDGLRDALDVRTK